MEIRIKKISRCARFRLSLTLVVLTLVTRRDQGRIRCDCHQPRPTRAFEPPRQLHARLRRRGGRREHATPSVACFPSCELQLRQRHVVETRPCCLLMIAYKVQPGCVRPAATAAGELGGKAGTETAVLTKNPMVARKKFNFWNDGTQPCSARSECTKVRHTRFPSTRALESGWRPQQRGSARAFEALPFPRPENTLQLRSEQGEDKRKARTAVFKLKARLCHLLQKRRTAVATRYRPRPCSHHEGFV